MKNPLSVENMQTAKLIGALLALTAGIVAVLWQGSTVTIAPPKNEHPSIIQIQNSETLRRIEADYVKRGEIMQIEKRLDRQEGYQLRLEDKIDKMDDKIDRLIRIRMSEEKRR